SAGAHEPPNVGEGDDRGVSDLRRDLLVYHREPGLENTGARPVSAIVMVDRSPAEEERERRLRNLRAVAQHLAQESSEPAAASPKRSAADRAAAVKRWGPLAVPILFL